MKVIDLNGLETYTDNLKTIFDGINKNIDSIKDGTTTVGKAITANKLDVARNINGMSIDGSSDRINFTTCSTASDAVEKTADLTNFNLIYGAEVTIKFVYANTASNPTLNVSGTGAKPIYYRGKAIPTDCIKSYGSYNFRYTGKNWELIGEYNVLNGLTATAAELNYCVGVTGNIQTQLNAKAASSHTHKYAGSSSAGGVAHTSNTLNYTMLHEGRIADTTVTKEYDYSYFTDYSYVGITAEIGDKLDYRLFPINAFCDYYNNPIGCKFTDGDKEGYVSYDVGDKYIYITGDVVVYEIVLFPYTGMSHYGTFGHMYIS